MKAFIYLFAILIFCSSGVKAGIIYTDIPDSTVSASETEQVKSYYLDLNSDGIYEFEFRHFNPGIENVCTEIHRNPSATEQVLLGTDNRSKVISKDAEISSTSSKWGLDGGSILGSPWYGGSDKYFGIRFKISNQWYYGWARFSFPANKSSFTIKDFAFNNSPGEKILAGQTEPNSVEESIKSDAIVYPNPAGDFIMISAANSEIDPANHQIEIFNSIGEAVLVITGDCADISFLQSGTYFVKVAGRFEKLLVIK